MDKALTLVLQPPVRLHDMNIFDIGTNKVYINTGQMEHELTSDVSMQIAVARAHFDGKAEENLQLAVPGFVIDSLAKKSPETLIQLRNFVNTSKVSLLAMPYYGSSLEIINAEELKTQIALQQEALKKHFKQESKIFYASTSPSVSQKEILVASGLTQTVSPKTHTVLSLEEAKSRERFAHALEDAQIVSTLAQTQLNANFLDMKNHVATELQGLYPHIVASQDEELLETWRLLAHDSLLIQLTRNPSVNSPYEQYTSMLNMCNDLAHKIKAVALTKKGIFLTDVKITDSPSEFLRDILEKD